jgi:hypothetical protein
MRRCRTPCDIGLASHPATLIGKDSPNADTVLASNQNIENNPMQRNRAGTGTEASSKKHFDTSGKSPAQLHHRGPFWKPHMALPKGLRRDCKPIPTTQIAPARHDE